MRKTQVVVALALLAGLAYYGIAGVRPANPPALPGPAPIPAGIEGVWQTEEAGAVVTIKMKGDGYFFQWNRELHQPDIGIGMRRGNTIYVGIQPLTGVNPMIIRYDIEPDKLSGSYMGVDGKTEFETLIRLK